MKDDLDKYISRRKKRDGKFAENFESGYQEFKVGVLLRQARAVGALVIGGFDMLVYQAAEAFRLWTGCEPPVPAMLQALADG